MSDDLSTLDEALDALHDFQEAVEAQNYGIADELADDLFWACLHTWPDEGEDDS